MIVIDSSVMLAAALHAPGTAIRERLLGRRETLHAPHLIDVEVAHVLRRYVRLGTLTPDRGKNAVADLRDFPIRRYRHTRLLSRAWELRNNVSAYDAMYVALAELLDAPLVTRDRRLANAAGHQAKIELI